MMKRLFFFVLLVYTISGVGQIYPVTAKLSTRTSSLERISDLGGFGISNYPLALTLTLNDLSIQSRRVELRVHLTGNGMLISGSSVSAGGEILLESGIPLKVPDAALAGVFAPEGLNGVSIDQYTSLLAEGHYEICIEVIDVLSGRRLSNTACVNFYLNRIEPPLLLTPERSAQVPAADPQSIFFQWTSGYSVPSGVQYKLSLVEVWDISQDPQSAFLSSPPIFETITNSNSFVYDIRQSPLLKNRRYAWQVKVLPDTESTISGTYQNQGESEVFWFDYVAPCVAPNNTDHEVKGKTQANIFWEDDSSEIASYQVRYRKRGEENEWFYSATNFNWLTLWGLEGDTDYEYQVRKKCELSETDFSISKFFTTGSENQREDLFDCGITPSMNIKAQVPLPGLKANEEFTAGDFIVKVSDARGANGRFSGKGTISIPYLANIRVGVKFTNIYINQERQLASGMIQTIYDKEWSNILDADEVIDVLEDITDEVMGHDIHTPPPLDFEISTESIKVSNGKILITGPDGSITELDQDQGDTTLITDVSGNQWEVGENGEIKQVGIGAEGGPVTAANTKGVVYNAEGQPLVSGIQGQKEGYTFYLGDNSKYAMDSSEEAWKHSTYPKVKDGRGNDYYPVHKAVITGEEEYFYTRLEGFPEGIKADSLVVKTMEGRKINTALMDGDKVLRMQLQGLQGYRQEQIVICHPGGENGKYEILATFYLHHLKNFGEIQLSVAGVDEQSVPHELNNLLDQVFEQVGVSFKIHDAGVFNPGVSVWDTEQVNGMLDYNGSGLLADYPMEFRNFQHEYMNSEGFTRPDDHHLFFLGNSISNTSGIGGFMPPGRQWGYVFTGGGDESKPTSGEIAVHEIGHGVFGLNHPANAEAEGLLMNRGAGLELCYSDWQVMNKNGISLHWFDSDTEKEIGGKTWFTPDWTPFRIPDTRVISSDHVDGVQEGAVPGFKVNGQYYHARMEESGFRGYYNKEGEAYNLKSLEEPEDEDPVYLFKYAGGCGYNSYYKAEYGRVKGELPAPRLSDNSVYALVATIPCEGIEVEKDPFLSTLCENKGEYKISNDEWKILQSDLERAHSNRTGLGARTHMPKGEFYHLINFKPGQLDEGHQVLEDKLFLLKALTGINLYVLGYDTEGKGGLANPSEIASELIEGSPLLSSVPTIVILAGYNTLQTKGGLVDCVVSGIAVSGKELLPGEHFEPGEYNNLYDLIMKVYTGLAKPYRLHRYYMRVNGEILHTIQSPENNEYVRGLPFINAAEFWESPLAGEVWAKQEAIADFREREDEMLNQPEYLDKFRSIRRQWVEELNTLVQKGNYEEQLAFESEPSDYWIKKESALGTLREALMDEPEILNSWYASSGKQNANLEGWKILFGNSVLDEGDFYDYDKLRVIDNLVYTGLDLATLIPNPYVETGAELSGLLYAALRGDLESAAIYSSGLIIPLSGVTKRIVEEANPGGYAAFAALQNDQVRVKVKRLTSAGDGEIQLTPILTHREDVATKIDSRGEDHYKSLENIKRLLDGPYAVRQLQNLKVVDWNFIPDCFACERGALEFWEDTSRETMHYLQDKYYIKHDLVSGEIIVGDVESRKIIGFFNGLENNEVVENTPYGEVIRVANRYFGNSTAPVSVTFNFSNGLKLRSNPEKCTTVVGNYAYSGQGSGGDLKGFIEEVLLNLKHQDFEGRPNGFNVLNVSEASWNASSDFWEEINRPWLLKAIERGDDIYAATDPMDLSKVFRSTLPGIEKIESLEELRQYLNGIHEGEELFFELTGFGKEIRLLLLKNYNYDLDLKKFEL